MLFRKNIEPHCCYCKFGSLVNEREVACVKRGIVSMEWHCRKFRYDPLKRIPPRPRALDTSKISERDFAL